MRKGRDPSMGQRQRCGFGRWRLTWQGPGRPELWRWRASAGRRGVAQLQGGIEHARRHVLGTPGVAQALSHWDGRATSRATANVGLRRAMRRATCHAPCMPAELRAFC